jgi:hypothetical protein
MFAKWYQAAESFSEHFHVVPHRCSPSSGQFWYFLYHIVSSSSDVLNYVHACDDFSLSGWSGGLNIVQNVQCKLTVYLCVGILGNYRRLLRGGWLIMAGTALMEWHQTHGNQVFDVFATIPPTLLQTIPRARAPQLRCHQLPVLGTDFLNNCHCLL